MIYGKKKLISYTNNNFFHALFTSQRQTKTQTLFLIFIDFLCIYSMYNETIKLISQAHEIYLKLCFFHQIYTFITKMIK